jgi:hypothetical protein
VEVVAAAPRDCIHYTLEGITAKDGN